MTIKEALATKTSNLGITPGQLDLAILEAGLDGSAAYDPAADGKAVDMVWAGLLLSTIRVIEVKEDDLSIKYTSDLKGIYSAIMRKWGMDDPFALAVVKPTVKRVSLW
jgi:hypothetical protein